MQILIRGRSEKGHVAERLVDLPELPIVGHFLRLTELGAPQSAEATRITPSCGEEPVVCHFDFLSKHLGSMLTRGWWLAA